MVREGGVRQRSSGHAAAAAGLQDVGFHDCTTQDPARAAPLATLQVPEDDFSRLTRVATVPIVVLTTCEHMRSYQSWASSTTLRIEDSRAPDDMAIIWLHRHLATPDNSKQMPVRESALRTVQPARDTRTLV